MRRVNANRASSCLLLMMLLAFGLRLSLLMGGGQFYFPDEDRYKYAWQAADSLYRGDFSQLSRQLFAYQAHPGFTVMAFAPAYLHRLVFALERGPDADWKWYWKPKTEDYRFSALFFALPSTLSIGAVYLLARRMGAGALESIVAGFLFAASNSMFLYSRHLLPYDLSLHLGLLALCLALGDKADSIRRAFAVGALAFLCFWLYHGALYLAILVALAYIAALAGSRRAAYRRATGMALAWLSIFGALFVYNTLALGINIPATMMGFAGTISQGSYDEGALLPWRYFWAAEGGMALLWLLGLAASGWRLRRATGLERGRGLLWLGCLLFLYLLMTLLSNGLQMFVVYGRAARLLAPFVTLLCAYGFAPWLGVRRWPVSLAFFALASILALTQFLPAIRWTWYMDYYGAWMRDYRDFSCETSFAPDATLHSSSCWRFNNDARYRIINAGYIYPITQPIEPTAGKVLAELPHPVMLPGLRFEGYTAEMRAIVEREPVMLQLIDTQP